jgi:hypothetical protein
MSRLHGLATALRRPLRTGDAAYILLPALITMAAMIYSSQQRIFALDARLAALPHCVLIRTYRGDNCFHCTPPPEECYERDAPLGSWITEGAGIKT